MKILCIYNELISVSLHQNNLVYIFLIKYYFDSTDLLSRRMGLHKMIVSYSTEINYLASKMTSSTVNHSFALAVEVKAIVA